MQHDGYICSMKYEFNGYAFSRDLVTWRSVDNRMTTRQAGEALGLSASTVSRLERRDFTPTIGVLLAVCSMTGKSPSEYFYEIKQAKDA